MMQLTVRKVRGPLSLQDAGRPNQAALGIPQGGFADAASAHLANALAGNTFCAPLLEIALAAPKLHFSEACTIALTGANMSFELNGTLLPMYRRVQVPANSVLDGGGAVHGCRAYLAIGGQVQAAKWRGSVSPVLLGEAYWPTTSVLSSGQVLTVQQRVLGGSAFAKTSVSLAERARVTVYPAPESQAFVARIRGAFGLYEQLQSTACDVLAASNRVGIRLQGPGPLSLSGYAQMHSVATLAGTVQLAPDGSLLVSHVDAPTMGGYPRIGWIDRAGLDAFAQLIPGRDSVWLDWSALFAYVD